MAPDRGDFDGIGPDSKALDYNDIRMLEGLAAATLPLDVYDYFAGAAGAELTMAANRAAWSVPTFRPHVLHGAVQPDCSTVLRTGRLNWPIAVAPMGYQRLLHTDGELATAAAAAACGVGMALSTYSTTPMEAVGAVAAAPWFQCYVMRDRGLTAEFLNRARESGFTAVVLTVDAPIAGDRRRDRAHGYALTVASDVYVANFPGAVPPSGAFAFEMEPHLALDTISWVAGTAQLPVLVKGILRADDAMRCVEAGATGVVVSNHGGRQLDRAITTAAALPAIAEAVAGRADVLVDGGIRTGLDVLTAIGLGADAVLLGRPVLWALAAGGAAGVEAYLRGVQRELVNAMTLCGLDSLQGAASVLSTATTS